VCDDTGHLWFKNHPGIKLLKKIYFIHFSAIKKHSWRSYPEFHYWRKKTPEYQFEKPEKDDPRLIRLPIHVIRMIAKLTFKPFEATFLGRKMRQKPKVIWLWERVLTIFYTYDCGDHPKPKDIMPHFQRADIFKIKKQIGKIIQKEGRTIIFCDNGDKPKEFNTFVPYMKKGDVIAVHDWGTEIFIEDVRDGCREYNLEETLGKYSDEEGATRFFQKMK